MALIFTLMVFVIGYGLQFWQNRRSLARSTGTRSGLRARAAIQPAVPVPVDADGSLELPELATPGPRT
jgi:hypothetical protein